MCTRNKFRIVNLQHNSSDGAPLEARFGYSTPEHDIEKIYAGNPNYLVQPINCGYCWQCKKQKAQEWAFRGIKELKYHPASFMVTLTYDDEHLPMVEYVDKETGEVKKVSTLKVKDQQQFMKNIRKKFPGAQLKLLGCGEYGSNADYVDWKGNKRKGTERPHYHLIIYGAKPDDLKFWKYSVCEWTREKNPLYKSKKISDSWGKGHADINEVNKETIEYVCRYTTKKIYGEAGKEIYDEKNRHVPYLVSSRKEGIGQRYFEDNKEKFWNEEAHYLISKKGLREVKPGRYFDKLMDKEDHELFEQLKRGRSNKAKKYWEDLMQKTDINKVQYIQNQESKDDAVRKKLKRTL